MDAWPVVLLIVSALLLVAAVLTALETVGSTGLRIKSRLRPNPPARVKFKSLGGAISRVVDVNNQVVGWDKLQPDFAVRNDGRSVLYELEAGAEDPRGTGERVTHPERVPRLDGEGSQHRFGSSARFQLPAEWLDDYDGQEPQKQVAYFIAATDEDGRRWETTCHADPADDWVPLEFDRA